MSKMTDNMLRRGDHVKLPDGRTGWINRLIDEDGRGTNVGPLAVVLLNVDDLRGDWSDIEITVALNTLAKETLKETLMKVGDVVVTPDGHKGVVEGVLFDNNSVGGSVVVRGIDGRQTFSPAELQMAPAEPSMCSCREAWNWMCKIHGMND